MSTSMLARVTCSLLTANCFRPRCVCTGCFRPVRHGDICSFINGELVAVDHAVGAGGARHGESDVRVTAELGCAQRDRFGS